MARKVYKVRDKGTGAFWNGDYRWSKFDTNGQSWSSREAAERKVEALFRYNNRFKVNNLMEKWEIVEFEVTEDETRAEALDDFLSFVKLKIKLRSVNYWAASFIEEMRRRGVDDKIEFMIKIKSEKGARARPEQMKEARAALKRLGVKSNTYRIHRGVLGIMDREQAMRARLTLDVDEIIDLASFREELSE